MSPAGNGSVFTESTSTASATVQGAIAYDTTNNLLKVCDGTAWQSLGGGGGSSQWSNGASGAIYYNGGNVGIGTTGPNKPLVITSSTGAYGLEQLGNSTTNGETSIGFISGFTGSGAPPSSTSGSSNIWVLGSAVNGAAGSVFSLYNHASAANLFSVNSSGTFTLAGNVTIAAALGAGAASLNLTNSTANGYTQLKLAGTGRTYQVGVGNGSEAAYGVANKFYIYDAASDAMRLAMNSLGNVGIGTTSPTNLLSLGGDAARTIWMERHTTANTAGNSLTLQSGGATSGATDKNGGDLVLSSGTATGTGSSNITFKTAPAGTTGTTDRAPATAMTILGNGNVGIGTVNPGALLHVVGGNILLSNSQYLKSTRTTGEQHQVFALDNNNDVILNRESLASFGDSQLPSGIIGIMGQNKWVDIRDHSNVSKFYVQESNGNVGIGTTAPNQGKLEVKGGTVCVDTDSDDNATSCILTESDARLKTNVRDLALPLDTFMKLRPVTFDWKYDDAEVLKHHPLISRFAAHPHSLGMIAQEVQQIVPDAIEDETIGDKDVQYLQLDYTKLVPVVIKAVQDLKREKDAEIEALKASDAALQAENAALKERLQVLEGIVLTPEARAAAEGK